MKTSFRLLAAFVVVAFISFARAGDFQSQVVQINSMLTINVPSDRFLVIRNFTQEPGAMVRGYVSVTTTTFTAQTVLTATILDPNNTTTLEPINDVVISGPSTVTVTQGDTNCFITYRKGDD